MSKYRIYIKDTTTQEQVSVVEYEQKPFEEALAMAYVYARREAAKQKNGEYVCYLKSVGAIFKQEKDLSALTNFSFVVKDGEAILQERKLFFGSEKKLLIDLKNCFIELDRIRVLYAHCNHDPKALQSDTFSLLCNNAIEYVEKLYKTYKPEYIVETVMNDCIHNIHECVAEVDACYKGYYYASDNSIYTSTIARSAGDVLIAIQGLLVSIQEDFIKL